MKYDGAPPVYLACASQTPISGVCSSSLSLSLIHSCTATHPHPFPSFLLLSFRFCSLIPSINSFLSARLSVHPFARPFFCLRSSPPIHPSLYPFIRPSVAMPARPSIYRPISPSVRPSTRPVTYPHAHSSLPPSFRKSVCPSTHSPRRSSPRPTRKRERFLLREDRSDSEIGRIRTRGEPCRAKEAESGFPCLTPFPLPFTCLSPDPLTRAFPRPLTPSCSFAWAPLPGHLRLGTFVWAPSPGLLRLPPQPYLRLGSFPFPLNPTFAWTPSPSPSTLPPPRPPPYPSPCLTPRPPNDQEGKARDFFRSPSPVAPSLLLKGDGRGKISINKNVSIIKGQF